MMPQVRTTVTLEPDVARLLSEQARKTRKSFKATLNAAVRSGLRHVADCSEAQEFRLDACPMQLRAGVDAGRFNALLDDLDADGFVENQRSTPESPCHQ
jgi:predicted transcriptional regulator